MPAHTISDYLRRGSHPVILTFNQGKFFWTGWPPQRHGLDFLGHALNDPSS
jgi:hypothetical protein